MRCSILNQQKKGQVTIFVIIAIFIVILGVLIFLFYPKLKITSKFNEDNPEAFLQNCVEDALKENVKTISLNGGYYNPEFFYMHQDEKFSYLCYSNQYYELCTVQEPFLKDRVESEITNSTKEKVNECFNSIKEKYLQKGYSVDLKQGQIVTEILPDKILMSFPKYEITITKETTKTFNSFNIFLNNNLYLLVSIATNIIKWETAFGEADALVYMLVYDGLKIQKLKQFDGTKLYIIEDKKTGEKFQFASRSLAFPPGY